VPSAQEFVPTTQGFRFVTQVPPATQALQEPTLQTWSGPQIVPFGSGTAALSRQTDVPVEQEVMPVRQGSGFVTHTTPAVQATHVPPLQTRSVPQPVPFGIGVAVSTQVCVPVAQEFVPTTQGFGFVAQVPPAVHEPQTPLLHTRSVPQLVPFATFVVVSTHLCSPVEQSVTPATHEFGLKQTRPAVHALHVPLRQTWFAPHGVPLLTSPVSGQTGKPEEHWMVPVLQTDGVHAAPCVQALQTPLPQTWSVPQLVPFETSPVSRHTGLPVEHSMLPVLQTDGVHISLCVQALQTPPLQTWFVPQVVPLRIGVAVSTHNS
jgi:hypothetical protein